MLSLRLGIWKTEKRPGSSSGTFNLLGKRFVVFVDENQSEHKTENSPDFWVTIKEHEDKKNGP